MNEWTSRSPVRRLKDFVGFRWVFKKRSLSKKKEAVAEGFGAHSYPLDEGIG